MIGVGCALSFIILPDGRASLALQDVPVRLERPSRFRREQRPLLRQRVSRGGCDGRPRTGSAAVVNASGGNVFRGGGCVGTSTPRSSARMETGFASVTSLCGRFKFVKFRQANLGDLVS